MGGRSSLGKSSSVGRLLSEDDMMVVLQGLRRHQNLWANLITDSECAETKQPELHLQTSHLRSQRKFESCFNDCM